MTTYQGWWQVPPHLLPATALGELEYPRAPAGDPVAWVEVRENWAGKNDEIALYDARACPPTTATARQLVAAAYRSARQRQRTCADCHARCQRPLPPLDEHDPRPLCPACRHVALLRRRQAELATSRQACAERARELLASPHTAVLQVDLTVPPPTPAGRTRPPTAAHVRAVDPDGTRLVDLVVRLVGPRAHHIPDGAVAAEDAAPAVHGALLGRRLLMWSDHDLAGLRMAARHKDLPGVVGMAWAWAGCSLKEPTRARAVALQHLAAQWRGQLGPAHPGASRLPATGHAWARERGSGHAHRSDPSLGGTCGGGSMSQGERETGRRVLRELAALLTASGVQAVYHQPPSGAPATAGSRSTRPAGAAVTTRSGTWAPAPSSTAAGWTGRTLSGVTTSSSRPPPATCRR
jgi:hypothetical protein